MTRAGLERLMLRLDAARNVEDPTTTG
jgi:hypothetical protein